MPLFPVIILNISILSALALYAHREFTKSAKLRRGFVKERSLKVNVRGLIHDFTLLVLELMSII